MYCVKCKKTTNTNNEQLTTTKNNRRMKRGTCAICETTKTQFVKFTEGGSVLNKFINNLPVEMHLPGHNFTGPGTKLNKRLNPDLTPKQEGHDGPVSLHWLIREIHSYQTLHYLGIGLKHKTPYKD